MIPWLQSRTSWLLLALTLVTLALGGIGCATTESDNASSRPWNTPKGWATGFPAGMYDRQR